MAARLRPKGQPPPVYCDSGDQFTVEVHHGGFFVGDGNLRSYVDEKVDFFDDLESDAWSLLWFDDFVEQLGYQKDDKLKFYWLLPGKTIADGLRILKEDKDTNAMSAVVSKVKNFVVYFDHDDIADGINWDDIVADPVDELPKVLSPQKVGEKLLISRKRQQFRTTEGESSGSRDNNSEESSVACHNTSHTSKREREEEAMRASADQVPAEQLNVNESLDPVNISSTQPPSTVDMTQGSTTMLSQMLGEETQESFMSQPHGPLPDPAFILSNHPVQRPTPLNTSTIAGRAALAKKKKASTSRKTSSKKTKAADIM